MKESKADLSYFDPYDNVKYVPHVIEPSLGLTRMFLTVLCDAYDEVETEEGSRVIMRFRPAVAPVKVAVLPIVKKLNVEAMEIFNLLSKYFVCDYDETGAIGKRYFRQDEIGTPFTIAVDGENFAAGQVTVRHRDTGLQDIVKISELVEWVRERVLA
jgi:glycyl-tRNA synthetase